MAVAAVIRGGRWGRQVRDAPRLYTSTVGWYCNRVFVPSSYLIPKSGCPRGTS